MGVYSATVHHELWNERFTLISFIGFAAILITLQPFQICICNRKYSKWTFSNGPHMMGKRCMVNLHASLDSTWKSRFSQNSNRYWGVYSTTFGTKLSYEPKKFPILWGYIQQHVILQSVMHHTHNALQCDTRCHFWGVYSTAFDTKLTNEAKKFSNSAGGYIPQLFIMNSEMKDLHWYLL